MLQWYYLVIIAAVASGAAAIIEKQTLKKEFATAYSTSFAFLIAIISIIFLPFAKFNLTALTLGLIYVFSLIATITYLVTARILRHSAISTSSPTISVLPTAFVVLLAFAFLGEKLSIIQYISIGVIVLTAYAMFFKLPQGKKALKGLEKRKYLYVLFINALFLAVASIISKYVLYTVDPFTFLILTELFIAINFIIVITFRYKGVKEMMASLRHHKVPVAAIAVLTTVSRIAYYIALSSSKVSLVQPLNNAIYVIIAVFVGGVIFSEGRLKEKAILTLIMVICVFILIM